MTRAIDAADASWRSFSDREDEATRRSLSPLPVVLFGDLGPPVETLRLVRGVLGEKTLAVVYGEPKSGKSFLVTDAALHVALGRPWFGRKVIKGAVLVIAAEGHQGYMNRLRAFRDHHALSGVAVPFAVIPRAVTIDDEGRCAGKIIAAVRSLEETFGEAVRLIVVDTMARTIAGDENSAADVSAFVRQLDRVREDTGACVVVVHHAGKDRDRGARGSNALRGAADTMIAVENDDGTRTAKLEDQKDGEAGNAMTFVLRQVVIGENEEGEPITSCVVEQVSAAAPAESAARLSPQQQRCLEALTKAIDDHGQDAPPSKDIPKGVRVVRRSEWRAMADRVGMTDPDAAEETKRANFNRAVKGLRDAGRVGEFDGWVWVVSARGVEQRWSNGGAMGRSRLEQPGAVVEQAWSKGGAERGAEVEQVEQHTIGVAPLAPPGSAPPETEF